jgi:hypothetical protein
MSGYIWLTDPLLSHPRVICQIAIFQHAHSSGSPQVPRHLHLSFVGIFAIPASLLLALPFDLYKGKNVNPMVALRYPSAKTRRLNIWHDHITALPPAGPTPNWCPYHCFTSHRYCPCTQLQLMKLSSKKFWTLPWHGWLNETTSVKSQEHLMPPRYLLMLGLARAIRQTVGIWCKWHNALQPAGCTHEKTGCVRQSLKTF